MNQEKILQHLGELEAAAEEILVDREEIVSLDRKRQKNREAIRALNNRITNERNGDKSWIMLGTTFIKFPSAKARTLLEKDQTQLDDIITELRDNLRVKVDKLRDLEKKPELKGFNLKPLSREEMSAVGQVLHQK